ncbi:MAG: carboxypeptidase M32 [Oscillospiraceae bacterium]|nr:carboxypeptidase M32 [Oscillospiraceae bacterium]
MTKTEAIELLLSKNEAERALETAQTLFHWDAATTGVPEKSLALRGADMGWLSGEQFRRFMLSDTLKAVETLEAHDSELDEFERAAVRETGHEYRKSVAVPPEEFQKFKTLVAQAEPVWEKARERSDFSMMLPYYQKIFDYQRRLCDWYGYEKHPYDALLDDYEKGANVEMLDGFFALLRAKIAPLLKEIVKSGKRPKEITGIFDIGKQRELMPWLCDFVGYDRTRGKVGEVEHPFCTTLSRNDVRITTKYHEDNLMSALFSTLHEAGHAVYEQNMDERLERYRLADGASMGMHESQSRLYENIICRSRAFAKVLLPKLREAFDFFGNWDEKMLFEAVNIAQPSLIRIEADELSYSLHIMVRYELEKALISGDIEVAELPGLWNDKYEEYLGIRPTNDAEGVLQDVHWSGGMVGYFPSYAIGTAYGSQLINAMRKGLGGSAGVDIDLAAAAGDLSPVTAWLKENVHKYGMLRSPDEILRKATGEAFNPGYYVDYLSEKFTALYLK